MTLDVFTDGIEDGLFGLRGRDTSPTDRPSWSTPGDLAKALDPTVRQTPALDAIDQALVDVDAGRCDRLIITMPPQEGKSSRITKVGPAWFLTRNPNRRVVVVSYEKSLANNFGREIRSMIADHTGVDGTLDLGLRIRPGDAAVSDWRLSGYRGGVRSIGMSGGITGRSADVLIIDDPISNRTQAESVTWRQRAKDFWTSTGSTRLSPGAPVILVLTRWHEDDLAGWLLKRPDGHRWRVVNIPAQADHDPEKGETDVLGRQPGEYMLSARIDERTGQPRSIPEWEALKVEKGSRDWQALYQGRPSSPEGTILNREWWRRYTEPMWLERVDGSRIITTGDELITSWDMAFKGTDKSDYVCGQVWLRKGANIYLVDQIHDRLDFPATVKAVQKLARRWPQSTLKLVEDKANGPAVIALLRQRVAGLVPDEPHGSKIARAMACAPLVEAGNVWIPSDEIAPWADDFIEECAGFPSAKHDDRVDAFTQATIRLLIRPLIEDTVTDEDYDDEYDDDLLGYG